jgi:hypothetical protein
MIWQELLVDRNLDAAAVVDAIVRLLPVEPAHVLVVADVTEAPVPADVKVLCERGEVRGEFPLRLSIYVRDPELATADARAFAGRLCELLGCRCLVPDGSPDPYCMLLVEGVGRERLVSLDAELLDEREEYVVRGDC